MKIELGGELTLLTITFVILKALGYIGWSWLWVLSPIWIPLAIAGIIFGGVLIVLLIELLVTIFKK